MIEANEMLALEVDENNLDDLLKVLSILNKIEERQMDTDSMFDPLKAIVAMLKKYNLTFENKIYLQVGVCP